MAKSEEWELPEPLRPQQSRFGFDLSATYGSVVLVHTEASDDGYSAQFLGTERLGSGVVNRGAYRELGREGGGKSGRATPAGVRPGQRFPTGAAARCARCPGHRTRFGHIAGS